MTAFYKYKKDQRETLDFSVVNSKEYIDMKKKEIEEMRVFL